MQPTTLLPLLVALSNAAAIPQIPSFPLPAGFPLPGFAGAIPRPGAVTFPGVPAGISSFFPGTAPASAPRPVAAPASAAPATPAVAGTRPTFPFPTTFPGIAAGLANLIPGLKPGPTGVVPPSISPRPGTGFPIPIIPIINPSSPLVQGSKPVPRPGTVTPPVVVAPRPGTGTSPVVGAPRPGVVPPTAAKPSAPKACMRMCAPTSKLTCGSTMRPTLTGGCWTCCQV